MLNEWYDKGDYPRRSVYGYNNAFLKIYIDNELTDKSLISILTQKARLSVYNYVTRFNRMSHCRLKVTCNCKEVCTAFTQSRTPKLIREGEYRLIRFIESFK